jgi:NAD-dependent dihydropyrimidine dehydrogenase PreA subunit
MPPIINKGKCIACGVCVDICPTDVFSKEKKKGPPFVRYPEEWRHCNSFVLDCNQSAIELRIPLPAMMLHVEAGGKRKRKS